MIPKIDIILLDSIASGNTSFIIIPCKNNEESNSIIHCFKQFYEEKDTCFHNLKFNKIEREFYYYNKSIIGIRIFYKIEQIRGFRPDVVYFPYSMYDTYITGELKIRSRLIITRNYV